MRYNDVFVAVHPSNKHICVDATFVHHNHSDHGDRISYCSSISLHILSISTFHGLCTLSDCSASTKSAWGVLARYYPTVHYCYWSIHHVQRGMGREIFLEHFILDRGNACYCNDQLQLVEFPAVGKSASGGRYLCICCSCCSVVSRQFLELSHHHRIHGAFGNPCSLCFPNDGTGTRCYSPREAEEGRRARSTSTQNAQGLLREQKIQWLTACQCHCAGKNVNLPVFQFEGLFVWGIRQCNCTLWWLWNTFLGWGRVIIDYTFIVW